MEALMLYKVWYHVAIDITFVAGQPYLTLIDCGPSRVAIWSSLANETAQQVIKHLKRVFQEREPPDELLCDNGPCFKSARMQTFLSLWGVSQVFFCAYRHSGNGIIEGHHRTIKRMGARTGGAIQDMVYWYNNTPNSDQIVPADAIYSYDARLMGEPVTAQQFEGSRKSNKSSYQAGDQVYVAIAFPASSFSMHSGSSVSIIFLNRDAASFIFCSASSITTLAIALMWLLYDFFVTG